MARRSTKRLGGKKPAASRPALARRRAQDGTAPALRQRAGSLLGLAWVQFRALRQAIPGPA